MTNTFNCMNSGPLPLSHVRDQNFDNLNIQSVKVLPFSKGKDLGWVPQIFQFLKTYNPCST